jgi:hypothetical protein
LNLRPLDPQSEKARATASAEYRPVPLSRDFALALFCPVHLFRPRVADFAYIFHTVPAGLSRRTLTTSSPLRCQSILDAIEAESPADRRARATSQSPAPVAGLSTANLPFRHRPWTPGYRRRPPRSERERRADQFGQNEQLVAPDSRLGFTDSASAGARASEPPSVPRRSVHRRRPPVAARSYYDKTRV